MTSRFTQLLLSVALVFIVAIGLRVAAPIVSAFILAAVLAQVTSPLLGKLGQRGLSAGAALAVVLIGTLIIGLGVAVLVSISLAQVVFAIPTYSERFQAAVAQLPPGSIDPALQSELADAAIDALRGFLAGRGEALGFLLLSFLIFAFMLFDAGRLPARLSVAGPVAAEVLRGARAYSVEVRRFLSISAMLGGLCGGAMAGFLFIVGVDFPLLWGFLLFVMSFVPAIGLLIASIPPIVLAFLQFGLRGGVIVIVGFVIITNVVAQFMKPKYLGQGLDLSRLVVFLSFVVWGGILGPIGALFAVPLTLLVKTLLAAFPDTMWLVAVLSGRPAVPGAAEDPSMLVAEPATSPPEVSG